MRFLESVYKIEWEEVLLCRVSIVLPVYNRRHCIARAVDSIMEQTFPDYELIIVDDNSADGTGEYIKSLPDRRIKFIPLSRNVGAGGARNIGIKEAAGEYIAFQDSDTVWMADKLEKLVMYLDSLEDSVAMVYSPYKRIYQDYSIIYPSLDVPLEEKSGHILKNLLEHPLVDTPTMLVRKDVLKELGGFDSHMKALEDYELSIRIAGKYQIGIIDEVLLLSYNESDSISNDSIRYIQNAFYLLKKHKELFKQYDMTMTYLNQLSQYALQYNQLDRYVENLQKFMGGRNEE